jgi:hypothetical protein
LTSDATAAAATAAALAAFCLTVFSSTIHFSDFCLRLAKSAAPAFQNITTVRIISLFFQYDI